MKELQSYIPSQPFFEMDTKDYQCALGSTTGIMAQYYSFTVASNKKETTVAVPDGTIDILFQCNESKPVASICGTVKKGKPIPFEADVQYFGARFLPGAAEKLLGCPLDEFTDQEIGLEDVLSCSRGLINQVNSAANFKDRIKVFEKYQTAHLRALGLPFLVSSVLDKINSTSGDIRIQELADETGYSARHINNQFRKHIGISPKLFTRIVRFHRSFNEIRRSTQLDFAFLAEDSGYYDQAHFINEFREFALRTPSQFVYTSQAV